MKLDLIWMIYKGNSQAAAEAAQAAEAAAKAEIEAAQAELDSI